MVHEGKQLSARAENRVISKGLSEEVTFWLSHNSKMTMNRKQRKVVQTEGKVGAKAMGKETALCILRT